MKTTTVLPRFIWCVFDGLRRDMITSDIAPNLRKFIDGGVDFPSSRSVFPPVTRVNTAAMACGAIPATTGIIANKLFDPKVFDDKLFHTGLHDHVMAAEHAYGGHYVATPALGDVLAAHGLKLAVISTGSAGTTHLLNPRASDLGHVTLCLSDWRASTPTTYAQHILDRFGPVPADAKPNIERMTRQIDIALNAVLPEVEPDVLIIWFTDPDATYHRHGIGSPESIAAIHHADIQFGRLLAHRDGAPDRDDCRIVVCSDHGQITARERVEVKRDMRAAGLAIGPSLADGNAFAGATAYYGAIRVANGNERELRRMADWLVEQPWCGPVFTAGGDDVAGMIPGTFSKALVGIEHERAPEIYYTMIADNAPNAWGLPGSCYYASSEIAPGGGTHGGLHPIEMNNLLALGGADLKHGYASPWPAGHTDIVPTILHFLKIAAPVGVTGRVLTEAIGDGGEPPEPQSRLCEVEARHRSQQLQLWRVGTSTYVDSGWIETV
ncbi:MAG TPA: alkaline phosphatase family protein [Burkholderiales bacterium]|nr:alkaline phosphatase family protein [Burkholderiales bacterium]